VISLPVLRKIKELVAAGATVLGLKPTSASGLAGYPASDAEVKKLADELWGSGRVRSGKTAREVLLGEGVKPDFEWTGRAGEKPEIDFIHRRTEQADIYFIANRSTNAVAITCSFRMAQKAPELWDAVSGEHHFAAAYEQRDGRTSLPLELDPCGSQFVVFRQPAAKHPPHLKSNAPAFTMLAEGTGPWSVEFAPEWGGPKSVEFPSLVDWTARSEPGIRFYSGTAIYRKSLEIKRVAAGKSLWLDLGDVCELAEVKINGQSCGIVWAPPFHVDITRALKPGPNQIEIEVVNFWPNESLATRLCRNRSE
jgi:hypothetical protein